METIDFTDLPTFLLTSLFIFLGIFGRYVGTALLFDVLVNRFFKEHFVSREVQLRPRRARQNWVEIGWSLITSLLFALAGTLLLVAWQKGYTRVYLDWNAYPRLWFFVSIGLMLFLHETYYYWLHRWMHKPGIYKAIHKVHHDSITTSAWTSFSFHPLESVLQAAFIPLMTFIVPLHIYALAAILTLMTITSAINHLNTELYPRDFNRHWLGRWWIGATHHSLHHAQFRYNYGLYFTFWDQWMRTESPDYMALFDKKTQVPVAKSAEEMGVKIH
ncbi:sterol desaturase family protein [Salmonirosea aquatica]|uniref:Sterol desaturase family protein n=1 Tax=Salmonirosea aquatica TaxID=2654236 RepID=A0A7C9FQD2_9BACT|nr:sterol desaturase family protein [Cytophagaceae bacterium SJW1-29]